MSVEGGKKKKKLQFTSGLVWFERRSKFAFCSHSGWTGTESRKNQKR